MRIKVRNKLCIYCKRFKSDPELRLILRNNSIQSACLGCVESNLATVGILPGFVYIIGYMNAWKIGITRGSVDGRLKELQTGNPNKLTILRSWLVDKPLLFEQKAHAALGDSRLSGEWFSLPKDEILRKMRSVFFETRFDQLRRQFVKIPLPGVMANHTN